MKENLIGKIVFVQAKEGTPVYYVVKDFNGQTLRLEHLKKLPDKLYEEPENVDKFSKKHLNIAYYSKYEE